MGEGSRIHLDLFAAPTQSRPLARSSKDYEPHSQTIGALRHRVRVKLSETGFRAR